MKPHIYFHAKFWWCRSQHVTGFGRTPIDAWTSMERKQAKLESSGMTSYCIMKAYDHE